MSASAIAMNEDKDASSLSIKAGKQEAHNSSDEEKAECYSPGGGSDEEGVEYLYPVSVRQLNPVSGVNFAGLTPEEKNKALIEALLKANPGLHLPIPKED